jgi:asparagine synthase (glutamine-hydrolysing)
MCRSDVHFPGGVDSCAVTGVLAEGRSKPIQTYTLGFKDQEDAALDESVVAERYAHSIGSEHKTLRIEAKGVIEDLLQMVWHLDEPYAGGLPSWYIYKFMAQDLKVGMTGSGGDELFSNYGYFSRLEVDPFVRRYMRIYPFAKRLLGNGLQGRGKWSYPIGANFEALRQYWSDEMKRNTLFAKAHEGVETQAFLQSIYDHAEGRNIRDGIAYIGLTQQLPEEFLMVTDRFSMAHSLEARTPFLDKQFVEFALSIPSETRIGTRDLKYLFKSALGDVLPEAVKRGKKYGFVLPLGRWLKEDLNGLVCFFLSPERLKEQGIFNERFWDTTVLPHMQGRQDMAYKIWPMLMFQLWHYLWIEEGISSCPEYSALDLLEGLAS